MKSICPIPYSQNRKISVIRRQVLPFTAPEDWTEKIVSFEIGAAMQKAEIRVNGVYHFTHFGGYQKFFIPLSDDLKYGELNELHITLNNAPSRDMPPGKGVMDLDFCYHSGLYRSAAIRLWDPVHITDPLAVSIPAGGGVFLRTEKLVGTMATLTASCHVVHEIAASQRFGLCSDHEQPNQVQVRLEIWDPAGNIPEVSRKVRLTADGTAEIIGGMEQTEAGIASWLVRIIGGEYRFRAEMIN